MSDDRTRSGGQDRDRVKLSEGYEVRDWPEKFGVTEQALRDAIGPVGDRMTLAEAVRNRMRPLTVY